MNFILAEAEVVGDSLPQPESKFSLSLDWDSNGRDSYNATTNG